MQLLFSVKYLRIFLLVAWLLLLVLAPDSLGLVIEFGGFLFLGVLGAIFANATGAGGGVVFIPFFDQLGLSTSSAIATSFAIQCCGMTAGALSWWHYYRHFKISDPQWPELPRILLLTVPFSILGVVLVQFSGVLSPDKLHTGFGIFSILLALAIFASLSLMNKEFYKEDHHLLDTICLPLLAFIGGGITAWLSVGVGELIAVYLIMRGFNITYAIATAVILTAFSVWGGIFYHLNISHAIHWQVWLFAGAGAIIGGMLAKRLVLHFSVRALKVFFATCVLLMGIATLIL